MEGIAGALHEVWRCWRSAQSGRRPVRDIAPGDEIALAFDASALPALPAGWERTFLLHADGFSKEMNLHSASPDRLEPLPFHAMKEYPYSAPAHYPSTPAHERYQREFKTRLVGGPVPSLDQVLLHTPHGGDKP